MQIIVQEKMDGVSLELFYKGGKLVDAVTRGDGIQGDSVISNAVHIRGVPQTITDLTTCWVRGEIVLPLEDFNTIWKPLGKSNPRNTVSGLCKGRSAPGDLNTLQFVAYELIGENRVFHETEVNIIKHLLELGFTVPTINKLVSTPEEANLLFDEYEKTIRDVLPWLTDGLVFKLNDISLQNSKFTIQDGRPTYSVARKPEPGVVVAEVIGIEWRAGLSGRFAPVFQVKPIEFFGTILRNCCIFNIDFLKEVYQQGFDIGAKVYIERTGDILPYFRGVAVPAPNHPLYKIEENE